MVIFVEQPDKTLLDWCENKWINYLNAKININKIILLQRKQCSTSATAKDTANPQGHIGGGSDMLTTSS